MENVNEPEAAASAEAVENTEITECVYCGSYMQVGVGIVLEKCLHNYCRDCIEYFAEASDSPRVECPVDEESGCGGILSDLEVKSLVTHEKYEEYLRLRGLKDFVVCREPLCTGIFPLTPEIQHFTCIQCDKVNCLGCKKLRDEDGVCSCTQHYSDDGEPLTKRAKVEVGIKLDWEGKWKQAEENLKQGHDLESNLDLLFQMESATLLENTVDFECSVCFCDVSAGNGVILKECFHMFCKECLIATVKHSEEIDVKCPHKLNEYSCNSFITNREIKALLPQEEHEKYLKRSESKAEMTMGNAYHCKTVNCPCWVEIEGDDVQSFYCPSCNKKNCVKCKAVHEGVNCLQYQQKLQEDEMDTKTKALIQKKIQSGKAMKCPTCKVIIEKTAGCDGIKCTICKTDICWATKGPRWGPKGHGDKSGGCHCREGGKRCHPKCRNCH